jgi:hypothetical protein
MTIQLGKSPLDVLETQVCESESGRCPFSFPTVTLTMKVFEKDTVTMTPAVDTVMG